MVLPLQYPQHENSRADLGQASELARLIRQLVQELSNPYCYLKPSHVLFFRRSSKTLGGMDRLGVGGVDRGRVWHCQAFANQRGVLGISSLRWQIWFDPEIKRWLMDFAREAAKKLCQ